MSKPLAALALLILFPAVAPAATRTVTSLDDAGAGTLREAAVVLAADGDVVVFDAALHRYTITLESELLVTKNITIDGTGSRILVSGNQATRVLHVGAGATVTVNELSLREGASTFGGCLHNQGTLTLNGVTIEECVATAGGGGIRNDGVLTANRSTISDNTASGSWGGGIDNVFGATLTLINSTVSGNFASGNGGGIDNYGAGATVSLVASTVANNRAAGIGGGIHSSGANADSVSLQQSILANNAAATSPDCSGTLSSADYNLVTSLTACALSGTTTNNITGQDPLLSALQVHGTAPRTHALRPGSPAMDAIPAGSCVQSADSRTLARPQDGDANATASCDMGAYEAHTPIVVNSLLDPTDPGKCTLRDAINSANFQVPTEACVAGGVDVAGDRIVFAVAGRIDLSGTALFTNSAVHFDGPGADRLTVSAERQSRVFALQEFGGINGYVLSGLTLANAVGAGGAVIVPGMGQATLAIDRVAFEDNVAVNGSSGGALNVFNLLYRQTGVEIDNSSFSNTLGRSSGAYIFADETSVRISNTTIGETRSAVAVEASTINSDALARVRLIDSTLVGSEPVGARASVDASATADSASIEYRNSIIAGHDVELATTGTGLLQSGGYNIIDDDSGPSAAFGDLTNTDPKVALHLYGGGPTRTIAPLPGSPAIDHVPFENCGVFFDQRGVPRPIDGDRNATLRCDAGAFETAPPIVVDSLLDTADPGKCRLRDAITSANANLPAFGCQAGLAVAPDLITFSVNGTIALGAPLVPTGSVAIRGPGATRLTIDGQGTTNVFEFGSVPGGDYTLTGVSIENGNGLGNTGGVLASGSTTFSLAEAVLRNNVEYSFAAVDAGPIQILGSTVLVDPGTVYGYLVQLGNGPAVIESSTVNDQFRPAQTQAVLLQSAGAPAHLLLKGATVNGTGSNGLVVTGAGAVAVLANSIFSDHGLFDISVFNGGVATSWGYNLSSTGGLNGTGDQINTDPMLGPLVTNVGETPVFEPQPGSPALFSIPAVNCGQAVDQRGIPRPQTRNCSIGAAEPLSIFEDGFESP